ncbi:hypothetical protein [Aureimonas phyllosphaerae]|uniref:Uncharacterized protein n=1 Tax=Aureimonas phyllosphaerae TaxID=1166078 RepID=A0A7W6FXD7_9HYPH|nr:hypothetical protein [Aureimonas phyllosphaerae]MBB3938012.1 hypothetical protein [Aureimonas phyllosphaerae]MBB3962019.1 hypothetical protein [Aureimonas phyllosphaerae]SFF53949.1 hypothetical protein SAMN05216566_12419 [Aureimonas phyllosphaerae]
MKRWIVALLLCGFAGTAQAQEPIDGSGKRLERLRQERERSNGVLRRDGSDAGRLDELLRMRQRSEQRVRPLHQPSQESHPANARNFNKNTVRTQ